MVMRLDLTIREYKDSDIHIVKNLNKVAMQMLGVYKEGSEFNNDLDDIKRHYFRNKGMFLIGTVNNQNS